VSKLCHERRITRNVNRLILVVVGASDMHLIDATERRVLPDMQAHSFRQLAETDNASGTRRDVDMIGVAGHEALRFGLAVLDVDAVVALPEQFVKLPTDTALRLDRPEPWVVEAGPVAPVAGAMGAAALAADSGGDRGRERLRGGRVADPP
jgi:hypothetical protein